MNNPGDLLFIPDKGEKEESESTEKRHCFKLKTERLKLRLVLEDLYEKPIAKRLNYVLKMRCSR